MYMYSVNKQQHITQHFRQNKRKYHTNRSKKPRLSSRSSADLNDHGTQIFKDIISVVQNNISISEDLQYRILTNSDGECRLLSCSSSSPSSSVTSSASIDLFRPRLVVSSNAFTAVFVHLVYNSSLRLATRCSFLLCVAANPSCLPSFSSTASTFSSSKIISFLSWSKSAYLAVLPKNFIWNDVSCFSSLFLGVQISIPCRRMGTASTG